MESAELAQQRASDQHLVRVYTHQPDVMPAAVRMAIESLAGDEPIIAYAMADLSAP